MKSIDVKKSIETVIKNGGVVQMPYKSKISDISESIEIYENVDGKFVVQETKFDFIKDSVDYYYDKVYSPNNYGYIEDRLIRKGLIKQSFGTYDIGNIDKKIEKAFKKESKTIKRTYIN